MPDEKTLKRRYVFDNDLTHDRESSTIIHEKEKKVKFAGSATKAGSVRDCFSQTQRHFGNKHATRNGRMVATSIDFISHLPVS